MDTEKGGRTSVSATFQFLDYVDFTLPRSAVDTVDCSGSREGRQRASGEGESCFFLPRWRAEARINPQANQTIGLVTAAREWVVVPNYLKIDCAEAPVYFIVVFASRVFHS